MSAENLKAVGANLVRGLGYKALRRVGAGGRILGRTGAVLGIGFLGYELYTNYKQNIETEPAYREMTLLQAELEKWTSAISCIGRDPLEGRDLGFLDEGGAINALFRKKVFKGESLKAANPKEAYILIGRAIHYIRQTEDLLEDDSFPDRKNTLVARLRKLQLQISETEDYRPIQSKLVDMVNEIKPIATAYSSKIYDCRQEIQKTLGTNAGWAAVSTATLGLVKKPLR